MPKKKKKISNLSVKNDVFSSRFIVDLKNKSEEKDKTSFFDRIEESLSSIADHKSRITYHITKIKDQKSKIKNVIPNLGKKIERLWETKKELKLDLEQEKAVKEAITIKSKIGKNEFKEKIRPELVEIPTNKEDEKIEKNKSERELFFEKKKNRTDFQRFIDRNIAKFYIWKYKYFARFNDLAFFSLFKFLYTFFTKLSYATGWILVFLVRFVYLLLAKIFSPFSFVKKYLPEIKINTRVSHKINYSKNKFLEKFYSFVKYLGNEFIFAIRQIGNIGPVIYLKIQNKKQEKRLKKSVKARVESQIEKFEYNEPKIKRKLELAPPFKVLKLAIILLLIIAPFKIYDYYISLDIDGLKGRVLGVTKSAFGELENASKSALSLDFSEAGNRFSEASTNFMKAQKELEDINSSLFVLASVVPNEEIKMAAYSKQMLAAGEYGSKIGENLSKALSCFFDQERTKDKKLTDLIDNFNAYAYAAAQNADDLNESLNDVDISVLPDEYEEQFVVMREKSKELKNGIISFIEVTETLKEFLGATEDKRYLLVFQNNTEMRASGGFIGSFALIDFSQGEIKNLEAPGGGSYDTAGGLTELVTAPEPLHLVDPLWHFWDANWWPDWPSSARKLMWFYEKSSGPSVDGVISFTPTVLEKFLGVFGEIDMSEEYGVVFTKDNFWLEVQKITEEKPAWHENGEALNAEGERLNPKEIIGDMMAKIMAELPKRLNQDNFIKLISLVEESFNEKHILLYFTDKKLQSEVESRGWDGSMRKTNWDYLSVINTNIAGGKSDKKIKETINHSSEIMPNGSVIDTLKITREHTGERGEIFSGVRNVDWMRIYVPEGSELLEAQGFKAPDEIYFEKGEDTWKTDLDVYRTEGMAKIHEESGTKIYIENGKTVFANWSMVDPGEKITVYLKYKLPFALKKKEDRSMMAKVNKILNPDQESLYPYALLVQKQPGSTGSQIKSSLKVADNFNTVWKYPKDLNIVSDGWQQNDILNTDKYWSVIFNKSN